MNKTTIETGNTRILGDFVSERIRRALASKSLLINMTEIFKVLSDPARLRILLTIQERELCVNHIAEITGLSQSSVSHHLKTLRQTRLVDFRRAGKLVYYSLADSHVHALIAVARDHANESL